MDYNSIFGHTVHCIIIILYSIVYIEIAGTHSHNYCTKVTLYNADPISAVVSRKAFPTLNELLLYKNRVRAACGVCGGQSGTGAGFLRVLRFPLPIIPPISPLS
jgi:hypothetical protein